jgi:hypothetical protein
MSKRMTPEQEAEARKAYIDSVLKDWPPMTSEQARKVAHLLYPDRFASRPTQPSAYELEQRRKENERAEALKKAKKAAEAMTACDVCDLQPEAHQYQKAYGAFHEWVPGRAEKLLKRKASK